MSAPYRNKKLTAAANGQPCTLQIPGLCCNDPERTVPCHSPLGEDRNGTKAPDFALADGCTPCHDYLDRRTKLNGEHINDEDQHFYTHRGIMRTLANRFERGILK